MFEIQMIKGCVAAKKPVFGICRPQGSLFAYVEDPVSGLLPAFTVPEILLWVLTAGVCAAAFVLTQGTTFGRMGTSVPAVSDVLFAVGFVTQFLADVTGPVALVLIYRVSCVIF